jgi:hypothetical protein
MQHVQHCLAPAAMTEERKYVDRTEGRALDVVREHLSNRFVVTRRQRVAKRAGKATHHLFRHGSNLKDLLNRKIRGLRIRWLAESLAAPQQHLRAVS